MIAPSPDVTAACARARSRIAELAVFRPTVDGIGPWLWPKVDDWGFLHPGFTWPPLRDLVLKHARDRRTIVQAGGCCGMYPRLWADHFATVYTFEPEPLNFSCLVQNCLAKDNIIATEAALSDTAESGVLLDGPEYNVGAFHIGTGHGQTVRRLRLDDLHFDSLDAIQLDCEGHEPHIIAGAMETISRHRPLLAIEGPSPELTETILAHGYREAGRCGVGQGGGATDVVFVPLGDCND
jgi:FkbM family methyltransferase